MSTVIHPRIVGSCFQIGDDVVVNFASNSALLHYFLDELRQPLADAKRVRLAAVESNRMAADAPTVLRSSSPSEWFKTRLWQHADYQGKSVSLSNIVDNIDVEWKLSDNGLNDKVSSVHVGLAIACVVLFQHSYLRGNQLWLIGGQEPSKRDLTSVPFEGGGNWNDRISSALSATLSPAQVLQWLAGLL